jgi:hypothetical protein
MEDERTGNDRPSLRRAFLDHLLYSQSRTKAESTLHDKYVALALSMVLALIEASERVLATARQLLRAAPSADPR